MTPELVIGIVSAIIGVGFVKVWLYRVFKYKIDEGVVLQFFEDNNADTAYSISVIAKGVDLSEERVEKVCSKSDVFKREESDKWGIAR